MWARRSSYRRRIHRYLTTDAWRSRSLRFRQSVGFRCRKCGLVDRRNHAHHLTYAHAFHGREPDSDLVCLCRDCHLAVHRYARGFRGSLRTATLRWLA